MTGCCSAGDRWGVGWRCRYAAWRQASVQNTRRPVGVNGVRQRGQTAVGAVTVIVTSGVSVIEAALLLVRASPTSDVVGNGEFGASARRGELVYWCAVEVADLIRFTGLDDCPCSGDEFSGDSATRGNVVVLAVDHEAPVVLGELRVVSSCDVRALVVDEP